MRPLHPYDPLDEVLRRLSDSPYSILPVVDGDNRLLGVVNLEEVHLASQAAHMRALILAEDLMQSDVRPLAPNDTLDRALELFVENDLLALPVVDGLDGRQVIGVVRRFDISSAYMQRIQGPAASEETSTS